MKIQLKQRSAEGWKPVNLADIKGNSIAMFMAQSQAPMVAAIFEDDKPVAFVSNSEKYVEQYKEKGFSISAQEILELLGTEVMPKMILDVFEEGTFEVSTLKGGTNE